MDQGRTQVLQIDVVSFTRHIEELRPGGNAGSIFLGPAEIIQKTEAAAGDIEILAQLKIETKQVAEAMRMNDRLLVQTKKKLVEVKKIIAMQRQSDMT